MMRHAVLEIALAGLAPLAAPVQSPVRQPVHRTVDLAPGERVALTLADGSKATVELIGVTEVRDRFRSAVRLERAQIAVNGAKADLVCANYRLPVVVGGVQVDCPVTRAVPSNSRGDAWGLDKSARLRVWPSGSPWIEPGLFKYPARQKWFASGTQMANEPTFVDGGEVPGSTTIYYHNGLDMGGAEGLVDVVAATDGLVVSSGTARLPGHEDTPVAPRYDVVYLLDARGWYYRYSHLKTIDPAIRPGATVKMGQAIGLLGKEGGSGGWSHLHVEISSRQPSGKWGTEEGYAFLWQAYVAEFHPDVIAVARPHHLAAVGESVVLDGSRSWARAGGPLRLDWTFADGSTGTGEHMTRRYTRPGTYSEVLKVTDRDGRFAYDFAVVQVLDPAQPQALPPSIQAAYAPSLRIKPGETVTFKVRTFRTQEGSEEWDFGDATPPVIVKSDGNANQLDPNGFAVTEHHFAKPGDYIVRVRRSNARGLTATANLWVKIE
jgi:murein DD-endopeptidase MepM/ murein hydrolase activator NlpD